MAAKTTFTARHAGFEWTRKSLRAYAHAVTLFRPLDEMVAGARKTAASRVKTDGPYHARVVAAGVGGDKGTYYPVSEANFAESSAFLAANPTLCPKVAADNAEARVRANAAARLAAGEKGWTADGVWCEPSFHGSLALAQREAQKGGPHAVILEAVAKG